MKSFIKIAVILSATVFIFSCSKENDELISSYQNSVAKGGGSGGGGGGNGGGNNTNPSAGLQSVLSGSAFRHVSGNTDSIFVSNVVQVPATYPVPAGVLSMYIPFTSSVVANSLNVTFNVSLLSQTKSTTIKVFPRTATFAAPNLQSPGNGAGFSNRTIINFTSNSQANAFYYQIQIDDNTAFTHPETDVQLNDPLWRQSAFSSYGTHYWRMRFVDASGNCGPWSATRNFLIRQ